MASFMLTVTAFAASGEDFEVNEKYFGYYYCTYKRLSSSYIHVKGDDIILHIYEDDDEHCFVNAEVCKGHLGLGFETEFFANYEKAKRVKSDGSPAVGAQDIQNYTAKGKLRVDKLSIKDVVQQATIISENSYSLEYTMKK